LRVLLLRQSGTRQRATEELAALAIVRTAAAAVEHTAAAQPTKEGAAGTR
jgi:hypothetical protein